MRVSFRERVILDSSIPSRSSNVVIDDSNGEDVCDFLLVTDSAIVDVVGVTGDALVIALL